MNSMTGYGRDVFILEDTTITVEIRSVNHRYLDFNAKIPRSLLFLEDSIKRVVQSYFHRGRVDVSITIDGGGFVTRKLYADWHLMDQYIDTLQQAKNRYGLKGDIPVDALTAMPDLISVQEVEKETTELKESIIASVQQACDGVLTMRREEGSFLESDLLSRMKSIQETIDNLQSRRETVIADYTERIQSRINSYVDDNVIMDTSRMHQEIALLAEKGDITEEIIRLRSHHDHFFDTIEKTFPAGRKLDFIVQEMHREANTIGSKSTDAKIGEWIVSLKSDIEKVKEQIQNIE